MFIEFSNMEVIVYFEGSYFGEVVRVKDDWSKLRENRRREIRDSK